MHSPTPFLLLTLPLRLDPKATSSRLPSQITAPGLLEALKDVYLLHGGGGGEGGGSTTRLWFLLSYLPGDAQQSRSCVSVPSVSILHGLLCSEHQGMKLTILIHM